MKVLLRIITIIILLITAIWTLVILHAKSSSGVSAFIIFLDIVAVLPLAFFAYMAIRMATRISQLLIVLIGAAAVSSFGIYTIIDAFYLSSPGPFVGLIFLGTPFVQWIGGLITVSIVYLIGKKKSPENRANGANHPTPPIAFP